MSSKKWKSLVQVMIPLMITLATGGQTCANDTSNSADTG